MTFPSKASCNCFAICFIWKAKTVEPLAKVPRGLCETPNEFKVFKRYVTQVSQRVVEHAQTVAAEAQRPYRHIRGKLDKETEARTLAERDGIREGLVCVFTRVEQAQSFKLKFGKGRPRLVGDQPKCLCVYFYWMDPRFGLIHLRLQTWFPFTLQVYLNGHEWLARQMTAKGMSFTRLENALRSRCTTSNRRCCA